MSSIVLLDEIQLKAENVLTKHPILGSTCPCSVSHDVPLWSKGLAYQKFYIVLISPLIAFLTVRQSSGKQAHMLMTMASFPALATYYFINGTVRKIESFYLYMYQISTHILLLLAFVLPMTTSSLRLLESASKALHCTQQQWWYSAHSQNRRWSFGLATQCTLSHWCRAGCSRNNLPSLCHRNS